MIKEVQKMIEQYQMIRQGDRILVGLSGGADSVALLLVLHELSKEMHFQIEAVHVNHMIRGGESDQDAEFVQELTKRLDIPCEVVCADVPKYCEEHLIGTEEGARELRYRIFAQSAQVKQAKVALAHHMDDNAETILFQMIRGSALNGLCGMQPIRTDEDGVCYIRPFLAVGRSQIEAYLNQHMQEYREDSTNVQLCYSRNYMRRCVLPQICRINAQAVQHINSAAAQLSDIREYMELEVKKAWKQTAVERDNETRLSIPRMAGLHRTMQKEVVYRFIAKLSGSKKDITTKHVESVLKLCESQSGNLVMLPGGLCIAREFDELCSYTEKMINSQSMCTLSGEMLEELAVSGEVQKFPLQTEGDFLLMQCIPLKEMPAKILQKRYTKWFDYDKIKEGFCIRTRESGDYVISDAQGHRKKIKQYFIDEKIPVSKRNEIPLLTQGQCVLWIIGGRISEHVKVTKDTKTILEITYDGGMKDEC